MPDIVYLDPLNPVLEEEGAGPSALIAADTGLTSLAASYSGVVVNQNVKPASPSDSYAFGDEYAIQEFFLPSGYRRGTDTNEIAYPDISGIQIMVESLVNAKASEAEWFIEYQLFGSGWTRVGSGVAKGLANDAPRSWFNIFFDNTIEINAANVEARMRFGIKSVKNITRWWYSTPNPLNLPSRVKAYEEDGLTPLLSGSNEYSFCFRILALSADEGVDFLGNSYRAAVKRAVPVDISTATGSDPDKYWLSKPNPSKFAVESLYFDVRKPASTSYGLRNWVSNPNGSLGTTTGWDKYSTSGATTLTSEVDGSALSGHAIQVAATGVTTAAHTVRIRNIERNDTNAHNMAPFASGVQFRGRIKVESASGPIDRIQLIINSYDSTNTFIEAVVVDTQIDPSIGVWYELAAIYNVGTGVSYYNTDAVLVADGAGSFTIRAEHFQITPLNEDGEDDPGYFDGDQGDCVWANTPHNSHSFQLVYPGVTDTSSVIDRLIVDPITPGPYFNIYYSGDGEPGTTEVAWESKLWTRVPQTYRMERRETHVLPEPIQAKYIKIEFSHLQAQHYAPGDFQQPTRYKKHPKWILDYFLARVAADQQNPFLAERVGVTFDALDLAYNYYLDDLGQEPQTTIDVNNTKLTQVTSFLSDRTDASDRIDTTTLNNVALTLDPFRQHPALRGVAGTLLADYARQTVDLYTDYPVEAQPLNPIRTADVSTLNRDRIVLEQDYPVMFFFLTCRHGYREVEAKFTYDRAYFVGVREIAFLRDNYMTAFDTPTYIEPNGDTANVERNEF